MKKKFPIIIIIIFIIIPVSLFIYTKYIERELLTVKKISLDFNDKGSEKLRVVQFTDTQLGEFYTLENLEKAVEKINKLNPDIVVFTGDLIDNAAKYKDIDKVSKVLSKINSKYGKYAIYGNHDYGGGAVRYYSRIMNKSGFEVLKNDSHLIKVKGKNIRILGADDGLMGSFNSRLTMSKINKDDINILLLHEPDLSEKFLNYKVDLILSGHSHGGQIDLPFYGPVVKNVLSEKYTKGLYDLGNKFNTKLYVSSGLGNTKLPYRFNNVPQVVCFDLTI
ncbi:MAG: metallophosphoesterase [Clostridium chrysemydis]|uniref:metallophosphoesterase n=1 Tax=Clostridium chrysemydis TaxID=2665504 RepID=UPI003F3BB631